MFVQSTQCFGLVENVDFEGIFSSMSLRNILLCVQSLMSPVYSLALYTLRVSRIQSFSSQRLHLLSSQQLRAAFVLSFSNTTLDHHA